VGVLHCQAVYAKNPETGLIRDVSPRRNPENHTRHMRRLTADRRPPNGFWKIPGTRNEIKGRGKVYIHTK